MTRIDQLRQRFAAGMAEGKISHEDWEEEFLPMILDAERYRWLCDGNGYFLEHKTLCGHSNEKILADAAIDSARTPTKEQKE